MGPVIDAQLKSLSYEETKKLANKLRRHGVAQFISLHNKFKNKKSDIFKWGDEVEYIVVKFNHKRKTAKLNNPNGVDAFWTPEYGAYMIEGTPGKPYGSSMSEYNTVETNMVKRRKEVYRWLSKDEAVISLTNFPRLGCPDCTYPLTTPTPGEGITKSLFISDQTIFSGHSRYITGARNIRMRRREKVTINTPVFRDKNTVIPIDDSHLRCKSAKVDHIYMDAMGFGMGCCCLQITFQAYDMEEARNLYDQLIPFCPIMLAITASAPLYRGFIADVDCRWNVIANSSDCRTQEERGLKPLKENKYVINKSRYDSVDSYLSKSGEQYNDLNLIYDQESYDTLRKNDVDHLLAQHIAHLFIRDSIIEYEGLLDPDDKNENGCFENIQSTNWQTMRFKVPPLNSDIGWRVEFRPCEAQITDFENAAFSCFLALFTRIILSYRLDFLMPITKVDENMQTAQKRGACLNEKFWFRKNINRNLPQAEIELMTLDEIFNGKISCYRNCSAMNSVTTRTFIFKAGKFPGLIPLVHRYLRNVDDIDPETLDRFQNYLKFIGQRASGKILTTASWVRKFVVNHPSYKQDSKVTEDINYDLLVTMERIHKGEMKCDELLGTLNS